MKARNTRGRCISALLASAVAVVSVGIVQPVTASAEAPDADAVSTVEDLVDVVGVVDAAALSSTAEGFEVDLGASDVTIPLDASGAITIDSGEGAVGLGIPGGASAEATLVGDQVVYSNVAADTNIVAQATADGGAQILITIDSPAAPTAFDFPVSVPAGGQLQSNPDGSIDLMKTVTDETGATSEVAISSVAPAWATDANGAAVSTHFTVNGNTITQTIDHNASTAYPIVADPCVFSWSCVKHYVSSHWPGWLAGFAFGTLLKLTCYGAAGGFTVATDGAALAVYPSVIAACTALGTVGGKVVGGYVNRR